MPIYISTHLFSSTHTHTQNENKKQSLQGTASPTLESNETFQRSLLAAQLANGKKNGKVATDAPPVNIGWDSHKPVVSFCCFAIIEANFGDCFGAFKK